MGHFEKELQKPPERKGEDISKRYKQTLDSVRVRQRKLFRFARYARVSQTHLNSTNFMKAIEPAVRKCDRI